jgi:molecular chaperone GrpE
VERKRDKFNIFSDLESGTDEPSTSESGSDEHEGSGSTGSEADTRQASTDRTAEECQALQEKYLRLAAEFENYKRLTQRDQRDFHRFANEQVLKEILPVVDNLERAIESAKKNPETDTIVHGVQLTLKQFLEILSKFGVRQISSIGSAFDPSRHQAVAQVDTKDGPENTVVEEYQKGYLLHERVLRPAMVAVAAGTGSGEKPGASASA